MALTKFINSNDKTVALTTRRMAGRGNYRKRKLDAENSQSSEEMSCLSAGSKLLQLVTDGNIKDTIAVLRFVPKNSKSFDAAFIKAAELGHKRILQKFIEKGVSINRKDSHGDTALHIASMHGYIDLVKLLVTNGAIVNCQNNDGQTPLMLGVKKASSLPLIEYLLSSKCCADINLQDNHGRTALMISTELQDFSSMKLLMSHKEIKLGFKDENGKTAFDLAKDCGIQELFRTFRTGNLKGMSFKPLVLAIKKRNADLVRSVLYTVTLKEVNTLDDNLYSPLMISVIEKCVNIEIVQMLLKAGADVNKASPNENVTALFLACKSGSLEAVKLLVKEGADVNYQTDGLKLTPLMCACENNATEIVKFLIKKKANINLKNSSGETALMLALNSCKNKDCVEFLIKNGAEINDNVLQLAVQVGWYQLLPNVDVHASKGVLNKILALACKDHNYELAKFVLECGAEVNQENGFKPLFFSALGSIDLVKLFLNFGADVNTTSCTGRTPLMEAVQLDDSIIIETLIKHGADIDASCAQGSTALMVAAKEGKLNAMKCLLDSGADLNYMSTEDFFYRSALNAAFDNGKIESAKLLLKRGANINTAANPPLFQSVLGDATDITLCLNHGANPNLKTLDGSTALMFALRRRCDHSKIKLLLDAGADPNIRNKEETALNLAAKYCTTPVLDLLIKRGADINATDETGCTALLCAVIHSIANDSKNILVD
ncbi:hypothetical protein Btru_073534 [Bulinus truncatus]|nr:hypothetical protein Btru_073534 [Bulinus truncatus]